MWLDLHCVELMHCVSDTGYVHKYFVTLLEMVPRMHTFIWCHELLV